MTPPKKEGRPVKHVTRIFSTTIGAKALMAASGLLLIGFVLQHMVANLQVFLDPSYINSYAYFMQNLGPALWVARLGLLAVVGLHIWAALKVTALNRAARPVAYAYKKQSLATTYAARTMAVSGIIVLLFIVYHILHFTLHTVDFAGTTGFQTTLPDGTQVNDVHRMVVQGFRHPLTAGIYIVANLLLAAHLAHGAASLLQTLGLRHQGNAKVVKTVGVLIGVVLAVGNVSMPLAALMGWIG